MGLWDSFKKKLEETWEGADFWDKQENQQQRQARVQSYTAPPTYTPPRSGGLQVTSNPTRTQVSVDTTPVQQPTLQVTQPTQRRELKLDYSSVAPKNPIDAGLDAGKSWEDIAKENLMPVAAVRDYSQATRPNYGIADIQRPNQSFVNKVRDVFDANTESDKWRRQENNKQNAGNVNLVKPVVMENPGNIITSTIGEAPAYVGRGLGIGSDDQQKANESALALQDQYTQALVNARKKLQDPNLTPEERARWAKFYVQTANEANYHYNKFQADLEGQINATNPYKGAAAVGVMGLDVISAGLTSVTGKQIVKQGVKQALKTTAPQLLANAAVNTTQGGLEGYIAGADAKGIVTSAILQGGVGTLADLTLAGGGALTYKGAKKINDILKSNIKPVHAFTAFPENQVKIKFDADVKDVPGIKPEIKKVNMYDLEFGSDTLATDISRETVDAYKKAIQSGEPINPLVVTVENGKMYLQDGKHRMTALQELGVENVPVVVREKPVKVAPTTGVTENGTVVQRAQPSSTKSISEVLQGYTPDKKVTENVDKLLAEQYGVAESTVRRLRSGYGDETARTILARSSDATNIRDMDAFVISEARKNYGSPNGSPQKTMSSEELQSLYNSAPEGELKVQSTPDTPSKPPRTNPETSKQIEIQEQKARVRDNGDVVDVLKQKHGRNPDKYLDALKRLNGQEDEIQVPVTNKDPITGETVTSFEKVNISNKPKTPSATAPNAELGNIAKTLYESTTSKDGKIGFRALEATGKKISREVDDQLTAIGSDFTEVAQKIQAGARNGVRTLEEAGLTPEEAVIVRKAQAEMNYMRRRASLGGKQVNEGDFGEVYLPQQKVGQYEGDKLFEGFIDKAPGNELSRKNLIKLEDLDYSPQVIGEYIVRYGDPKSYYKDRIFKQLQKANPDLDEDILRQATEDIVGLQGKINNLETKISGAGFGKRSTISRTTGEFVDTAEEMSTIGKKMGKDQIQVTGEAKGLTNGDKINSVMVNDRPLGDFIGLNQYRDAQSYASKQIKDAGGDRAELARMVEHRLNTEYNLSDETIEYIVGGIQRMKQSLPDEVVNARITSTYRMAAKQQMMEQMQNIDIKSPKLRKTVSNLANQILREGTIEQKLSSKVVSKSLQTTNAIFRKLNVSSALNELGDLPSFMTAYGRNITLVPDFKLVKEFGLGEIDAAIEPYIKQLNQGKSLKSVLSSINNATNLYKFVEAYKAGVVTNSAKKHYIAQGLTGDDLTRAVLRDYRDIALPVDAFTKTALDNFPLYTQYMTWGVRNLQKEGRLLTGKLGTGQLGDMTRMERVFRNAYANLPAKTVWWLTSNGLKGTGILTAFGLTDFTGLTNQDFSGIRPEDKSWFDKTTQFTNSSTMFSILNSIVQEFEKEQLKEKYADASYNPYESADYDQAIMDLFTPQFIKNADSADEMRKQGYSENASGRVQYEAPTDAWNWAKAYIFGKGQTANAREYSGRENIADRIKAGENPFTAIKDMAAEQLGLQDTDYNRPLTEDYTAEFKKLQGEARTKMLEGGRAYNNYLDDLRDTNKPAYDNYIKALDGNHVSPEYWKRVSQSEEGEPDLTIFNMIKDRKKQLFNDLGTPYDPIYDLPENQALAILQQKSTATGDDIALRNVLYKEDWYQQYMQRVKDYYNNKETVDSDFDQTQRVKDWYNLNDQYNALRTTETDTGQPPEWATRFPIVYQQKLVNAQYGFDSEESKNFFRNYGDQYKEEKAVYDQENLALINKMREIEGFPPMSAEAYAQATAIKNTDKDSGSGYNSGSGSSGTGLRGTSMGQRKALVLPSGKIKTAKVNIKRYKPKAVKIKRSRQS